MKVAEVKRNTRVRFDRADSIREVLELKDAKAYMRVAAGETKAMNGWLVYGAALNEGRRQLPGKANDRAFGVWCTGIYPNLGDVHADDRAAAMWAAEDPKRFRETKRANLRVRTVRGLHAKWKEAGKPAPQPERHHPRRPTEGGSPAGPEG